jgi:hypothetical protein
MAVHRSARALPGDHVVLDRDASRRQRFACERVAERTEYIERT